jgi:glycogen(starch) synthase
MKIAIYSSSYAPAIGGLETIAKILAEEFSAAGHCVAVVTQTVSDADDPTPYRVVRRPSSIQWMRIVMQSDITLHMNVSLRTIWASFLARRPCVVVHHGWYGVSHEKRLRDRLKDWCCRWTVNISVSRAVAQHIRADSAVIPNCYDDHVFKCGAPNPREGLAFVGRLVSDKGADVLLRALAILRSDAIMAHLSIIGGGPERSVLERLAASLGIGDSVEFLGPQPHSVIVEHLNGREVLVVPSVWQEPFGVVALEAIACGCVVVGTNGGGLPEAIGECGLVAPTGDPVTLAEHLKLVLSNEQLRQALRQKAPQHLKTHSRAVVAARYLALLTATVDVASLK